MEACLDKIFALSRTECPCMVDNQPSGVNEGQSGIYLDELEGLSLTGFAQGVDCDSGSIWDMMAKARENATIQFKADILATLESSYEPAVPNFSGTMGQKTFAATLPVTNTYAGQKLKFHRKVGGYMRLKRIGLLMNASTNVQVRIYDNDEHYSTPIAQYTIASTANTLVYGAMVTPLELPMWSRNVTDLEYYVVYTVSGFMPKDNKVECVPCSGGAARVPYTNWLKLYGITGSDTSYNSFNTTEYLNGLVLDVDLYCQPQRVICSDEFPIDFNNSGRGMQIAYAIRFKAGQLLLDQILSSPEINRYTMMDREALYGKRNSYRANYEKWVQYISDNHMPMMNADCWRCKPNKVFARGTITA